jgi:hypothetical protein
VISIKGVYEAFNSHARGSAADDQALRWPAPHDALMSILVGVSLTAAGICLLLTHGTNEHVQSRDGEFPFVVD